MKSIRHRAPSGAALVIILAFVVLLTVLVVAFFSRAMSERQVSNSSAMQTKVDLLADGAVQSVIGDLEQEIVAGSTNAVTTGTIYAPVSAQAAVPSLALSGTLGLSGTAFAPNLVKRSAYNQPFYSNTNTAIYNAAYLPANRAAPIATTGTSQNGRFISLARWNKALLLPKQNPSSSSNLTPVTTGPNLFIPPDWVLVARDGSNPGNVLQQAANGVPSSWVYSATNTSTVIGRYAYAVYDEGGLLDMNVAGCPADAMTPSQYAYKSSLAFADLTQTGLNQPQVDAIVGWRNYASAQASGAFPSFTSFSGSNYSNSILSNTTGFLTVSGSAYASGQTDRMFTSRQQLISMLSAIGTVGGNTLASTQNALQYLGTFSREVNAPTFNAQLTNFLGLPFDPGNPSTARPRVASASAPGNPTSYQNDDPTVYGPNSFNTAFPNTRFPAAVTIVHYRDDGSSDANSNYSVQTGTPLLQRRFSLAKLAWLGYNGPANGVPAAAIQACFGLAWNPNAPAHWDYVGPVGSTVQTQIETLYQVAQETPGREPNFFELLQASLAVGSLGRDAGTTLASNNQTYDQKITLQVLQIGANIIDQAATDNYPRSINIGGAGALGTMVTGIDDIPYINKIIAMIGPIDTQDTGNPGGVWWLFEIWNPHQMPASTISTGPSQFEIFATGVGQSYGKIKWSTTFPNVSGNDTRTSTTQQSLASSGTLQFTVAESSTTARLPTLLTSSSAANVTGPTLAATTNYSRNTGSNWIGLFGGSVPRGNAAESPFSCNVYVTGTTDFQMEYQDASGNWCPCSAWKGIKASPSTTVTYSSGTESQAYTESVSYVDYKKPDPRTDRFGCGLSNYYSAQLRMTELPHPELAQSYNPESSSKDWSIDGFEMANQSPLSYPGFFELGVSRSSPLTTFADWSSNNENCTVAQRPYNNWYYDPDGLTRRGDAMYATLKASDSADINVIYGQPMTMNAANPPSRPIILHRPFRSVAELGYAFRDEPWKTLDFTSSRSGDSALLDVFSVSDQPAVVAGRVDLNTRNVPVLASLLSNAAIDGQNTAPSILTSTTEALGFARQLAAVTSQTPFYNRSDLINRLAASGTAASLGVPNDMGPTPNTTDNWGSNFTATGLPAAEKARVKSYRESAVRALADATQVRTWNLLIDVIAQSGRYTQPGTSLQQGFIVEGEKHYWVHLALDRCTGQIVSQQWEPVNE